MPPEISTQKKPPQQGPAIVPANTPNSRLKWPWLVAGAAGIAILIANRDDHKAPQNGTAITSPNVIPDPLLIQLAEGRYFNSSLTGEFYLAVRDIPVLVGGTVVSTIKKDSCVAGMNPVTGYDPVRDNEIFALGAENDGIFEIMAFNRSALFPLPAGTSAENCRAQISNTSYNLFSINPKETHINKFVQVNNGGTDVYTTPNDNATVTDKIKAGSCLSILYGSSAENGYTQVIGQTATGQKIDGFVKTTEFSPLPKIPDNLKCTAQPS